MIALWLFFTAHCLAATPRPLDKPIARLRALVAAEKDKPANEVRALDKKIAALGSQFASAGASAAPPLSKLARDPKEPLKVRVWAVNFLALLDDPAAFEPLSTIALDRAAPEMLRDGALSGVAATGVDAPSQRRIACAALAQDDLPEVVLDDALLLASRLGCDDVSVLDKRARAHGARPKAGDARRVALALTGISKSHPPAAVESLFSLFDYFAPGRPERGLALTGILAQKDNLPLHSADQAAARACADLSVETEAPGNAIAALHLLVALGGRVCEKGLLRELKNPDAEVVAEDAEALASLRVAAARKPLQDLIAGAIQDERFAPRPGRPDPAALLNRVQAALNRLP